ncbi:MAG: DEAD/DEAH box helicase [Pseudomonadota bacterium]
MPDTSALLGALTPSGQVALTRDPGGDFPLPLKVLERIEQAFAQGTGHGLLRLGAAELGTPLDPLLAWWRELGRQLVAGACALADPLDPSAVHLPDPPHDALAALVAQAPPMRGAERLTPAVLAALWSETGAALAARAAGAEGGLQGFLASCDPVWNLAGRVCLHLAENKRDPLLPFAFLATYARQVAGRQQVQHLPLGRALQEYAGARMRQELVALLTPLQRAAQHSPLVAGLIERGEIYHPLAWSAAQAHAFLCEAEAFERAGLVLRLPDWWRSRRRGGPVVSVTVGDHKPSALGLDALLDFRVDLTLGGEPLSAAEIEALLGASAGLQLIKGQWVEVDPDRLGQVLAQWRAVQAQAEAGGVSFAEAMRLVAGVGSEQGEDDLDERPRWSEVVAGRWLEEQLDALRDPATDTELEARAGLHATLRPYQRAGLRWLQTLWSLGLGGCLADDMGLGKTIQVIALLSLLQSHGEPGVDLLVVPASLVENWRLELARFAPRLKALIAHPSQLPSSRIKALEAAEIEAHHLVITTYGAVLRTPWMQAHPWRAVVLDEAQAIKNPAAKQTRAVKALPSRWRLALTGTPVENRLGDLWSLFDFLDPGLLGSAPAFGRACRAMAGARQGYAPLRTLVSPYVLRRLKTDRSVISDLPDKIELTAHCLLSRVQAAHYQQAVRELALTLEQVDGMERRGIVLAFLMRFKQICDHPSLWLGDEGFEAKASGKLDRLAELCEPIAERQEKVLVFTQFRTMCEPLRRHLEACFGQPGLVLHGGTPVRQRQALVDRFQQDERVPFLVLSLKAGGTGLNLTAANHVVHFDRWWNPAVENQATDRAFRIGQRRKVLVHKFVCRGTVEERIDELIAGKRELAEQVLSGGAEVKLTELSNRELMAMVSLDLNRAVST